MDFRTHLEALMQHAPEEGLVPVPVAWVRALLDDRSDDGPEGIRVDLTVEEVGQMFSRSPQRVRDWLRAGELDGYKLHGREWRIPRGAIQEFQERQQEAADASAAPGTGRPADLGAWRRHRGDDGPA